MTTDIQTERPTGTRERLVDSAIGLLHTQAYRAVGVQALCEVADVRKGSFYHFFASKEDLTIAALDQAWSVFRAEVVEPAMERESDPTVRNALIRKACLDSIGAGHRANSVPHGCIFARLAASVTDGEGRLKARLGEIFEEWAELFGGGPEGWAALADIQGSLVLGFVVDQGLVRA